MQQQSHFYNRDGLDLLTGAPTQRSLRIWINHMNEPRTISKRPVISLQDSSAIFSTNGGQNSGRRGSVDESSLTDKRLTLEKDKRRYEPSTRIFSFDARLPVRRDWELSSAGIHNIGCTGQ